MRPSAVAAVLVSLCMASQARAQSESQPAEPSAPQGSAIFGAAEARGLTERGERLDLLLQVFGGYDDDVLANQGSNFSTNPKRLASAAAGLATGVGASLMFDHPGLLINRPQGKGDFRAFIDSSLVYYPALDNLTGVYHRFGLWLSAPVNRRLTFYASPRADYSPRYSFQLLPGSGQSNPETGQPSFATPDAPPPTIDYSVVADNSFRYGMMGGAGIVLGSHSTLNLDASYTRRTSDVGVYDMEVRTAGVSFGHQLTSNASLELGYAYQDGFRGTGLETTAHNIKVGMHYRKPLSRTRKTFVAFNTGSTVARSEFSRSRVQAIGSASLVHYFQRTWTAVAEYRRRLSYVDGFDRPLFSDGFIAGVNGLVSRQMELIVRANYTSGTVGLNEHSPRFENYLASVRLRRALSRQLAGYVEGLFYHYAFDENAPRPPGLPRMFDRAAFRFGLTLWVPLTH